MLKKFKLEVIKPYEGAATSLAIRSLSGSSRALHDIDEDRLFVADDAASTICVADDVLRGMAQVERNSNTTAWLSGLIIADGAHATPVLKLLLQDVGTRLRQQSVTELWAVCELVDWLTPYWESLGFIRVNRLMTMQVEVERLRTRVQSNGINVTIASPFAAKDMAQLDAAVFAPQWQYSDRMIAELFTQEYKHVVAYSNGVFAGYVAATVDLSHVHLTRIAVDPQFARQGVGSAMMERLIQDLNPRSIMTLNTPADAVQAHQFYRKLGFVENKNQLSVVRWLL